MAASTFGERFRFSRVVQSHKGADENDVAFAKAIGMSSGSVSTYKTLRKAPPAERALKIARRCGVDPGWLEFGSASAAPAPPGFAEWLTAQREREKRTERQTVRESRPRRTGTQSR